MMTTHTSTPRGTEPAPVDATLEQTPAVDGHAAGVYHPDGAGELTPTCECGWRGPTIDGDDADVDAWGNAWDEAWQHVRQAHEARMTRPTARRKR